MPVIAILLSIFSINLLFQPLVFAAATIDRAEITKLSITHKMETNRFYEVQVKVKNVGTTIWDSKSSYGLGTHERTWQVKKIAVGRNQAVFPGDTTELKFKVKSPGKPGNYPISLQMKSHNNKWFGNKTDLEVVVENKINRSRFISQVIPSVMEANKNYDVIVQFRNAGKTAWSGINGYALGSRQLQGDNNWQTSGITLKENNFVTPGDTANINFALTAPDKPGTYELQWQMRHAGDGWFGDKTPGVTIRVLPAKAVKPAEFVLQTLPGLVSEGPPFSIMKTGNQFPVKIVFKNTGLDSWDAANLTLVSRLPDRNLTWMIDTLSPGLNAPVRPGEFVAFEFRANAPVNPGIYDFQWQLHLTDKGYIGDPTPLVKVTVMASK